MAREICAQAIVVYRSFPRLDPTHSKGIAGWGGGVWSLSSASGLHDTAC